MGFVTPGFRLQHQCVEGAILMMLDHGITTRPVSVRRDYYERTHSRMIADNGGAKPMRLRRLPRIFAFFLGFPA